MLRVGYDAQTFLSPQGGLGKGLQLRNLLGRHIESFPASHLPRPITLAGNSYKKGLTGTAFGNRCRSEESPSTQD